METRTRNVACAALALLLALGAGLAAAAPLGTGGLRLRYAALAPQLARSSFGVPLTLESNESARRIEGDLFAVLDQPFGAVGKALGDPAQWCDVLILHINNKYCRRVDQGGATLFDLRVGKKTEQAVEAASLLQLAWHPAVTQADYLRAEMTAPDGPYDTRDYRIEFEAIPLDAGHTFVHMAYGFGYGGASHFALNVYLSTLGRNKVGFSPDPKGGDGYVGGLRGVVERNAMRYYLAIEAYMRSLAAPAPDQLEQRLRGWFDATERYPRQLRELGRDDYLRMKRNELRRQVAAG